MDQLQAMRKEVEVLEVLAKRIEMTKDMIKRLEGSLALDVGNYGKQIAKMRKLVA